MPRWKNRPLRVFHGTDSLSVPMTGSDVGDAASFAVDLALCRPFTDFGQGFYTTTRLHQAEQWANARVLKAPSRPGLFAIVLAFDLDRDWLAGLDALAFVRPSTDFWDLVEDCRNGFPPHQRLRPPSYDVVNGPVTLWPQKLIIADCDQISFHTPRSVDGLGSPLLQARAAVDLF